MLIKNNFMRYDSLQNIKGSSRFSKDQQHFWSNDGASIFLKVFSPKNSWVAIAENRPQGLYFSKALFEGLTFGGAYIQRGLSTEGNLRFKIDRASLIVGRKFTIFALFYFVFEGNFHVKAPGRAYIWRGNLTEGFLRFWGAYIWRGLFSEFYGISRRHFSPPFLCGEKLQLEIRLRSQARGAT